MANIGAQDCIVFNAAAEGQHRARPGGPPWRAFAHHAPGKQGNGSLRHGGASARKRRMSA